MKLFTFFFFVQQLQQIIGQVMGVGLGLVRMPQKATYKTRYIIITIALAVLADSAEPKSL